MKSQVYTVWIAGASILAVIGVLSFSLAYQVQSVVRGLNERSKIEAINEVEFVKKALHQSLIYSAYQSAYEVLKFGEYPTAGCDPEKLNGLPYWRTNDNTCSPGSVKIPLENKIKERFTEYLTAIQEKTDKINIKIPKYDIALIMNDDSIDAIATADDKIKFETRNLEISNNGNIVKTIPVAVNNLVKIAEDTFTKPEINPITPLLEEANTEMNSVDYGELKDCKQITIKDTNYCGKPVDKTKAEILSLTCPNALEKFEDKIVTKISRYNALPPSGVDITLYTDRNNIQSSVDTNIDTCQSDTISNYQDCPCISWSCPVETPVIVGDSQLDRIVYAHPAIATDLCAPCISRYTTFVDVDVQVEMCVQYETVRCPADYPYERSTTTSPLLPTGAVVAVPRDTTTSESVCAKLVNKECSGEDTFPVGSSCYRLTPDCHPSFGPEECQEYVGEVQCPTGSVEKNGECWAGTSTKQCPTGTKRYGSTDRCYSTAQVAPTCDLHDTLYTKTCTYDYSAEANVLVSVRDENKYPVYDTVEKKTDLRNLELRFYVLSQS